MTAEVWVVHHGEMEPGSAHDVVGPFVSKYAAMNYMKTLADVYSYAEQVKPVQGQVLFCPVSPALADMLRQPGGLTTRFPVRMELAEDNTITIYELRDNV